MNIYDGKHATLTYTKSAHPNKIKFERHCHERFELIYVVQGKGKCFIEGAEYPLVEKSCFLFRPFEYHNVFFSEDAVYERYVCHFDKNFISETVLEMSFLNRDNRNIIYCSSEEVVNAIGDVCEFSNNLKHFSTELEVHRNSMMKTIINQILLLISLEHSFDKKIGNALVDDIIEFLNENLTRNISLDDVAKHFFVSKYYLCRIFKKYTGATIFNYVNSKRIANACLLINSGESLNSVAYKVGFNDYSSFYRAYKNEMGKAPSK